MGLPGGFVSQPEPLHRLSVWKALADPANNLGDLDLKQLFYRPILERVTKGPMLRLHGTEHWNRLGGKVPWAPFG